MGAQRLHRGDRLIGVDRPHRLPSRRRQRHRVASPSDASGENGGADGVLLEGQKDRRRDAFPQGNAVLLEVGADADDLA